MDPIWVSYRWRATSSRNGGFDGGQSYAPGVVIATGVVDRPYLAVDPTSNAIYTVWMNFGQPHLTIRFSKSTDQGVSYTPEVQISSPSTFRG